MHNSDPDRELPVQGARHVGLEALDEEVVPDAADRGGKPLRNLPDGADADRDPGLVSLRAKKHTVGHLQVEALPGQARS